MQLLLGLPDLTICKKKGWPPEACILPPSPSGCLTEARPTPSQGWPPRSLRHPPPPRLDKMSFAPPPPHPASAQARPQNLPRLKAKAALPVGQAEGRRTGSSI
jgi:hypothetical protein